MILMPFIFPLIQKPMPGSKTSTLLRVSKLRCSLTWIRLFSFVFVFWSNKIWRVRGVEVTFSCSFCLHSSSSLFLSLFFAVCSIVDRCPDSHFHGTRRYIMRPPTFGIASLWITTVCCWIARREVDFSTLAMTRFNYKPQTSYPFKT